MRRFFNYLQVALMSFVITGCSSQIEDYSDTGPSFDLFGYFNGRTLAWGMVQDYTNKQTRRFEVEIVGSIENNTLTLVEDFVFDDDEVSQRIWRITKTGEGEYQGEAEDVIGLAYGKEQGNALHWRYDLELQREDSTVNVSFDDWMYRQDEIRMFNLAKIKKFGIEVGRVTLFFEKK